MYHTYHTPTGLSPSLIHFTYSTCSWNNKGRPLRLDIEYFILSFEKGTLLEYEMYVMLRILEQVMWKSG